MRERAYGRAILACFLLGGVCLASGTWWLLHSSSSRSTFGQLLAPVAGIVAGLIFLGFGVDELIHRLRRGPQKPGRHTKRDL